MAEILRCLGEIHGIDYAAYWGDCVDGMSQMPSHSVGFSIYSPPFADLFTYSESECDIGNNASDADFYRHYKFAVKEKTRLTAPGRLTAVHCSDLPSTKWKDGVIGTKDFSDDIKRIHEACGWQFVRRITIWKDPVIEMTRTKALNLLHKQVLKDSTKSWPGLPDYLMVFRAPGENAEPVTHTRDQVPVSTWQKWASPVWMDVRQTHTLNVKMARGDKDEKHVCPLQLDTIERAILLWSNPGNIVLSPFMGIGSEGHVAIKQNRRFIGIELHDKYFTTAARNLAAAEAGAVDLFASEEAA